MSTRAILASFFFLAAAILMASPSPVSSADWVDRMAASEPSAAAAGPDWADRMAAALAPRGGLLGGDWIDRLVAGRSAEVVPESLAQIERVENAMVDAGTARDVDRMVALFSRDAVLTSGGRTYSGIDQIRAYWLHVGPFRARVPSKGYAPAGRVKIIESGDQAIMQLECVWVDSRTQAVKSRLVSTDVLSRHGGAWLITRMSADVLLEAS